VNHFPQLLPVAVPQAVKYFSRDYDQEADADGRSQRLHKEPKVILLYHERRPDS
jgi:hypothetical protein